MVTEQGELFAAAEPAHKPCALAAAQGLLFFTNLGHKRKESAMMSDYEPKSGWNLPPGCFESDPAAPWNRPDPWDERLCNECRHCKFVKLLDGTRVPVCAYDVDDMEQINGDRDAEECFEE